MTMGRILAGVLVLLAATAGTDAGCTRDTGSPVAPTSATRETFSGQLDQRSSTVHPFDIATAGQVDVSISGLGPLESMAVGIAIGTWDGTSCSTLETNANARQGTLALSGTAVSGRYCLQVFDSGNLAGPARYHVQVLHH